MNQKPSCLALSLPHPKGPGIEEILATPSILQGTCCDPTGNAIGEFQVPGSPCDSRSHKDMTSQILLQTGVQGLHLCPKKLKVGDRLGAEAGWGRD